MNDKQISDQGQAFYSKDAQRWPAAGLDGREALHTLVAVLAGVHAELRLWREEREHIDAPICQDYRCEALPALHRHPAPEVPVLPLDDDEPAIVSARSMVSDPNRHSGTFCTVHRSYSAGGSTCDAYHYAGTAGIPLVSPCHLVTASTTWEEGVE